MFLKLTLASSPFPTPPQRDVRRQIDDFLETDEGQAVQHFSSNITKDPVSHDTVCNIVHNLTPAGQVRAGECMYCSATCFLRLFMFRDCD